MFNFQGLWLRNFNTAQTIRPNPINQPVMKHLKNSTLVLLALFLAGISALAAQELKMAEPQAMGFSAERLQRLDDAFKRYAENGDLPGGVILLARKDRVVYHKAFGYADPAVKNPMPTDALFRIASQTKALVSTGILMLQEEGKLHIGDPLSRFIPEFEKTTVAVASPEGGYDVVPAERQITLRDLLTHTSGIGYGYGVAADAWQAAGIQGWYFADRSEPIMATVRRMAALPMDAQPGTQFVYGYSTDILGAVIEAASGQSLDVFLKEHLFAPLGMNDTYFYLPSGKERRLAPVFNPGETGGLKRAPDGPGMDTQGQYVLGPRTSFSGGAGVVSSAADYYRFLQMMENGGELDGKRLLSSRTVALMTANHLAPEVAYNRGQGFGLGFSVVTDSGQRGTYGSVGEFGWGGAYHSTYWVDPQEELIVVYFTQVRPGPRVNDHAVLRNLVYQALAD